MGGTGLQGPVGFSSLAEAHGRGLLGAVPPPSCAPRTRCIPSPEVIFPLEGWGQVIPMIQTFKETPMQGDLRQAPGTTQLLP
jgi:hypothetical protein